MFRELNSVGRDIELYIYEGLSLNPDHLIYPC
jgi:hypothetical protein